VSVFWVLILGILFCGFCFVALCVAEVVFGFDVMKLEMGSMKLKLVVLYWLCICVD